MMKLKMMLMIKNLYRGLAFIIIFFFIEASNIYFLKKKKKNFKDKMKILNDDIRFTGKHNQYN